MAANVETMFYTRTKPWHGLGTMVEEAPTSGAALELAGLDWRVVQKNLVTEEGITVPGFRANLRETDNQVLGVVSDRYKVVQNEEAFAFTDELLGEGVTYETAGSLQNGRRTWILAKLPTRYIISGDEITPYLVFMNSHDTNSCCVPEYVESGAINGEAVLGDQSYGRYPGKIGRCEEHAALCG